MPLLFGQLIWAIIVRYGMIKNEILKSLNHGLTRYQEEQPWICVAEPTGDHSTTLTNINGEKLKAVISFCSWSN